MASTRASLANVLLVLTSLQSTLVHSLPRNRAPAVSATPVTSAVSGVTQVPSTTVDGTRPGTVGSILTSLETSGEPSSQPFATTTVTLATPSNFTATPTASILASADREKIQESITAMDATDAFQPVATDSPPSQITSRGDHPVPRLGIAPTDSPLSTNKFYANLFLGGQGQSVWTHPYSVSWSQGSGNAQSWGLSVQHIEASQRAYGPTNTAIPGSPVSYFINPLGIQSIILSATELGSSTVLTTDTLEATSVNANLQPQAESPSSIVFPLVQGMGFVTGIYTNLQPAIESGVFFNTVVSAGSPKAGVFKYQISLADGTNWLLYAMSSNGQDPNFQLASNMLLQGPTGWSGTIQIAKNPAGSSGEASFDGSAGVYPTTATVSGSVSGTVGTYTLQWTKAGISTGNVPPLIMFALPHHLETFDSSNAPTNTSITLQTTTKGIATAFVGDSWTLVEPSLPTDMGFAPWSPSIGSANTLSSAAISAINNVASSEVNQDMGAQSNLNSMYYAGKALSKFATIVYTIHDLANNPDLAAQGLQNLETAFSLFSTNQQMYPLVYDTAWKGAVSSASYATGDSGADFGNTYYNDHHFHYGYFIYAAAIIGYLDPAWLTANKDWVNTLVRDASNPSAQDTYFPVSRSFDWYHGHSFAKGLFESGDSKDEESSSEDALFAYAIKMWGQTIGDASMEARGNLMLSIKARSLQNYFLLQSDNTNQPANFIGNKVTGILFENKIDHTTYFGGNLEYIQGIHMIPLIPSSALTRTKQFVTEEWNTYFAEGAVDPASGVVGGWKGILYANLAISDPVTSFNFFSQPNFDASWLDGGASQTWYLAYAAGLGGA